MTTSRRTRPILLLVLLVVLVAATVVVYAVRQGGSAGSEDAAGAGESVAAPERAAAEDAGGDEAARAAPLARSVVSTGSVSLHSRDVARDRAEVLRLTAGWGGTVADEESTADRDGGLAWSSLTLRVPSGRFDAAMTALAGIGQVQDQSRSAEDVTTRVLDNDARVRAQERSVRRIESLLAEADDLGEVIAIESDLARRQADLDSLAAQQAYLADQTSLSTIGVSLDATPSPPASAKDATGFLAGLDAGWLALLRALTVLLTALGALLPFAVVLGLLGVPAWLVARRHRRTRAAASVA